MISPLPQRSETSYRFVFLIPLWLAFDQAKWLLGRRPGVGGGLGKARKPALILINQQPILVGCGLSFQPVPPLFFAS